MLLQEAPRPTPLYSGSLFAAPIAIPAGSVLVTADGRDGYLVRNGLYVHSRPTTRRKCSRPRKHSSPSAAEPSRSVPSLPRE